MPLHTDLTGGGSFRVNRNPRADCIILTSIECSLLHRGCSKLNVCLIGKPIFLLTLRQRHRVGSIALHAEEAALELLKWLQVRYIKVTCMWRRGSEM